MSAEAGHSNRADDGASLTLLFVLEVSVTGTDKILSNSKLVFKQKVKLVGLMKFDFFFPRKITNKTMGGADLNIFLEIWKMVFA